MSETKERSGIFKFFYIFLSIITFPIFAVLFVLRHPLWILFILMLLAGGAAYWPMSHHNVALTDVVDWYKNKYQTTKLDLAKKAIEEGKSGYVPKAVLDEMKKIEEDAKEAALPKGENYNAKVVRDQKSEELKASIKKRGGFKKKSAEITEESVDTETSETKETEPAESQLQNSEADVLTPKAGGLSSLLPVKTEEVAPEETSVKENLPSAEEKQNASQETSADAEDEMDLF